MLKDATGALICMRKSSRRSAFGTVTRTTKAAGTCPGTAADRKSRPPHTRDSDVGKGRLQSALTAEPGSMLEPSRHPLIDVFKLAFPRRGKQWTNNPKLWFAVYFSPWGNIMCSKTKALGKPSAVLRETNERQEPPTKVESVELTITLF